MYRNRPITFLLTLLFATVTRGEIISTYSIESSTVKDLTEKIDLNTIVLINIDDTLIRPASEMFLPSNPYHNFIDTMIAASKDRPFFNKPLQTWFINRKLVLTEDTWPEFIEQLKMKSAQIWGLNSLRYKIYELFQHPEQWRYNELTTLKVTFNQTLGDQQVIKLSANPVKQPLFYKGVIFTAKANKAETILDLLRTGNLRPKKIIVFDHNKNELKMIERALRKFDIDFIGINYLAVSQLKTKINQPQVKLQQDTLIHEDKWLEDAQSLEILKSQELRKNHQNPSS